MSTIIVNIYGGLGNQMFMYAMARAIKGKKVYIRRIKDKREYGLDKYTISLPIVSQRKLIYLRTFRKIYRKFGINYFDCYSEKDYYYLDEMKTAFCGGGQKHLMVIGKITDILKASLLF